MFVVISPFSLPILLIWTFFPLHFSQICQGFINLIYFFKDPALCMLVFFFFLVSISLILALIFVVSLLLVLGLGSLVFIGV
jgi:hypothetical protein